MIRYSPGMPRHPLPAVGGWRFEFPGYEGPLPCRDFVPPCPSANYITTKAAGPLHGSSIELSVEIKGRPEFNYALEEDNTCSAPASARLLIQRRGDDLTEAFDRWWSNPGAIALTEGQYSLTVPLNPGQWQSVDGKNGEEASDAFYAALEEVENIGLTFGGGCYYGHGVNVSGGEASFALKRMMIRR